jgi:hypothetical protein
MIFQLDPVTVAVLERCNKHIYNMIQVPVHTRQFWPHKSNVVWSHAKLRFRLNVFFLTGKGRKGPVSALFII